MAAGDRVDRSIAHVYAVPLGRSAPTGSRPHVLRHTAATLRLTSGIPVHIVAARLGDDPSTVLSTYAHLLPLSDEQAAERVAALISVGVVLAPG
jgi:integrase